MSANLSAEEKNCTDLDEFWNAISPPTESNANYLFRGHADATWKLKSSLDRKIEKSDDVLGYHYKARREFMDVYEFVQYCDQARIVIPGDSQSFRQELQRYYPENAPRREDWPPSNYYNIIALMQHFGYPTSFLDWTHSPYIAAFFAASEIIYKPKKSSSIAVWRLDANFALYTNTTQFEYIYVPPNNRNVYAQQGTFTLMRQCVKNGHEELSVEDFFKDWAGDDYGGAPFLKKVTLGADRALEVIKRCANYSINYATVFPDYTGVIQQLELAEVIRKRNLADPAFRI